MIILKLKPTFLNNILHFSKGACPVVIACIGGLIMFLCQNINAQNVPKKEEKTVILKENQKDTLRKDLKNTPKDNLKKNDTIPSVKISPKKTKKGFKSPFGRLENVRLGVNLLGLGLAFAPKQPLLLEINAEAELGKWLANIDIGTSTKNQTYQETTSNTQLSTNYNNQAFFFKVGGDYNVIKKNVKKHLLFFGFRYAHASFTENIQQEKSDTLFTTAKQDLTNKVSANWLEGTFGMKVNIWKNLYVGYTLRYKTALWTSGSKEFLPYDVPAFGKPSKNANVSISYYVWYCFPVKKR